LTRVREVEAADRAAVDAFADANHSAIVARRGELADARREHAVLVESETGELLGVATWIDHGDEIELLTLHAARQWHGAGTALLERVAEIGRARGRPRLWLVTTNDNVDALRFYQRRGMRLRALRPGAVDEARRTIKPGIAELGEYGIPIRDELELELDLR
jgi:GNAT superfamily N-acetyltransferase